MPHSVRLADLQALGPHEREDAIRRLVADAVAPTNGQAVAGLARIREYERRYEMTSATLLEKLGQGEIRETAEIADWLFWLKVRGTSGGEKARP